MPRLRLAVDTIIIVLAALKPTSLPANALFVALTAADFYISNEIFDEYEKALTRAKFGLPESEVLGILETIYNDGHNDGHVLKSHTRLAVADDPKDNKFLECALACEADYLITGNLTSFPKRFETTQIVSPRQFLTLVGQL